MKRLVNNSDDLVDEIAVAATDPKMRLDTVREQAEAAVNISKV